MFVNEQYVGMRLDLAKHHDDTVGTQEARRVSLVQSHVCLHRRPGTTAELLFFTLGA